ncbi:MAG: MazG family protein [Chlamydiota bacterium]
MQQFESLLEVAETLLGPNGCPWDRTQTFHSLQPYVLEEAHEVIEAVDAGDDRKIVEELGDLLYTVVFYGKLAEKHGRFSIDQIVTSIREKLIRRHPHVFGDVEVKDTEDVIKNWEKIKAEEKKDEAPKPFAKSLPPTLPAMVRAQKVIRRKMRNDPTSVKTEGVSVSSEGEIGEALLALIAKAEALGIDAESALRRSLLCLEND